MNIQEGTRVTRFEVWSIIRPAECILTVEGDDCEGDLGMKISPGTLVGRDPGIVFIDNIRYGPE